MKTPSQTQGSPPLAAASGSALDRPTILAVRRRIIEMYESLRTLADQCYKEEGGQQMGDSLNAQIFGMIKVRQMVGAMLDEQDGKAVPGATVRGAAEMPATTKAALVDMVVAATEAMEQGDFDDETNQPTGLGAPGAQMQAGDLDQYQARVQSELAPSPCSPARAAAYATIAAGCFGGPIPPGHKAWLDAQDDATVEAMAEGIHPSQESDQAHPTAAKASVDGTENL